MDKSNSVHILYTSHVPADPGNLFELRKQCYKELQTTLKDLKSRYSQDNENDDLPENASHDDDNIKQLLETVQNQMMMLLYTWEDDYYMAIASLAALRSKDPRTPVSSVTNHYNNYYAKL